jgi:membrane-associated phospholipid phosphatase
MCHGTSMNAASSRLRFTGVTSSDMAAIWPGTLLVVYLTATGVMLLIGHDRVSALAITAHFTALAVIATTTWMRGVPGWLRSWAPLLLLLFLYSEMPAIIAAVGHSSLQDAQVIAWEASLFNSQPAAAWARAWDSLVFSESVHVAYLLYYPVIFAIPALLYVQKRQPEFQVAVTILLVTFIACFLCYAFFPVAGPRYLWPSAAPSGPFRQFALFLLESRSSQGTAFPSSHVAVATTQAVLAVAFFGVRGLWLAAVAVGIAAGAVYGGFHYAVDIIAGIAVGVALPLAGLKVIRVPDLRRQ